MTADHEFYQVANAVPLPIHDKQGRAKDLQRQIIPLSKIEPVLDSVQLVRGWIGLGTLALIYGPSNSGKTFVTADLGMHIAAGIAYRGQKVRQGQVVYIAAEGGGGIKNRLAAMKMQKPRLCEHDGFHLLPTALDLHATGDAVALCQALPVGEIALVVVDTMARSMGAGDENSARDTAQFVANLDYIRNHTGATVLVVHHSGKNAENGARGSSALRAAVDTEIAVTADRKIECLKQRDMEIPKPIFFDLQSVELGIDVDGDVVSSAIVIEAEAPQPKSKPLTGVLEVALQALDDALMEGGRIKHGPEYPYNRKAVHVNVWRAKCNAHGLTSGTAPSAARTAFSRAKASLMDKTHIRMFGDYVWKV